ncbi:hypothetical protein BCAH1134_C0060 (plasmid) [Bacillus cereus AH1134]|nr:hypothetical protein BCAH1134_C0060 [Bacillus cereus AH1134]
MYINTSSRENILFRIIYNNFNSKYNEKFVLQVEGGVWDPIS